jgi:hypothetical protein
MYKIIRIYLLGGTRIIKKGLTFEQVQKHVSNPETSWLTCKKAKNVRRTKILGPWFDGHCEM